MIKSKFISDILLLLLDGDEDVEKVKGQLAYISETELEYTGAGVFISFEHTVGIEKFKSSKAHLVLDGVTIKSLKLKVGAATILFFKNGLIDYLELWSFNGEYPQYELTEYELYQEWVGSPEKKITRKN